MQVNATTLVQICNFWITYHFLKRILFKPMVAKLSQKKALRKALRDDLKYKETALRQLQEKKNRQFEDFKVRIEKSYQAAPPESPEFPQGVSVLITKDCLSKATLKMTDFLIRKGPDAF